MGQAEGIELIVARPHRGMLFQVEPKWQSLNPRFELSSIDPSPDPF